MNGEKLKVFCLKLINLHRFLINFKQMEQKEWSQEAERLRQQQQSEWSRREKERIKDERQQKERSEEAERLRQRGEKIRREKEQRQSHLSKKPKSSNERLLNFHGITDKITFKHWIVANHPDRKPDQLPLFRDIYTIGKRVYK